MTIKASGLPIAEKSQKLQSEWFEHLIRIAKPADGADSLCTNPEDSGGVDKSLVEGRKSTCQWDADPDSRYSDDVLPQGNWKDKGCHFIKNKNI